MITVPCAYRIEPANDEHTQRIVAVDSDGAQIVGAYRPVGLNDWRVYMTKMVADAVGLQQPHKAHVCSRADAIRWIDAIATLYSKATTR